MGEIKSTLDLIMERTKNLTMTEEEKRAAHRKELEREALSLVAGFVDGRLDIDDVYRRLPSGEEDRAVMRRFLRGEALRKINPHQDPGRMLTLLDKGLGVDTRALKEIIHSYQKRLTAEETRRIALILEGWAKKGISGSAVVADLGGDPSWTRWLEESEKTFRREIDEAVPAV